MALVTTTGSIIRQYNAFTGLSARERSQSGIARAEIVYYNGNDDWPIAGAGNNREYTTGFVNLPQDFGYVLTDCYVSVAADADGEIGVEMTGGLRLYPGGILGPRIETTLQALPSAQNSVGNTAVGSIAANAYNTRFPAFGANGQVNFELVSKPSALIYPFGSNQYTTASNPASVFQLSIGEQVINKPKAYDVTVYLRFLQYDVDQSYNYVIQSPQLTR